MHEDPGIECSLLPQGGRVLCVLSAGDMAFELLRAGASRVIAADPNLAQHELVRWKLNNAAQGTRQMVTGIIDSRLRWLVRWIAPLVFPRCVQQADVVVLGRHFTSRRWRMAWWLLGVGITVVFPSPFRRHLPADVVARLRRRFETACITQAGNPSPWLQRMLCARLEDVSNVWDSTWPDTSMQNDERLTLSEALLHQTNAGRNFDLVAASNILDTAPAADLLPLLATLASQVRPGGKVVLRSLFREANEWPPAPLGWEVDAEATLRLCLQDHSPLCRVSVVLRRTAEVASA